MTGTRKRKSNNSLKYGHQVVEAICRTNHDVRFRGSVSLINPSNNSLVIWIKIVTAMVNWIVVDMGSFVDIITLEWLKKLQIQ